MHPTVEGQSSPIIFAETKKEIILSHSLGWNRSCRCSCISCCLQRSQCWREVDWGAAVKTQVHIFLASCIFYHFRPRSEASNYETKLKEAEDAEKSLTRKANENEKRKAWLSEKISTESAKAEDLEQHKRDLADQNEFLKNFLWLVTRLCLKTEVAGC